MAKTNRLIMKPISKCLLASLVLAAASGSAATLTNLGTSSVSNLVSAEKTSFLEVTSQLDPGGNLFLYLGTEQWLDGLSAKVAAWRQLLGAIPDLPDEARENIDKGITIVTNLIKSSGLEDISGVGVSSIAREKGFYHSKLLLHHYPGRDSGFLWSLLGRKPHSLDELSLLSTNTAFATFADLDIPLLWSIIQKQAAQSGFPQASEFLDQVPQKFQRATGLKWEQVLGSLGGEFGFTISLNQSKKVKIPLSGDETLEIPEPALMILVKVKDDTIFKRIDTALDKSGQSVFRTDKPNYKLRTVALPIPIPVPVAPSIAYGEGYLFLATSDLVIQEALAVKTGAVPGIKSTAEFQRLAKELPSEGNQLTFISERFGQTVTEIQRRALASHLHDASKRQWLESILDAKQASQLYTVSGNTERGWLTVANGTQHPGTLFLVSAVAPMGILAGAALPALAKAKQTAQKNTCIHNLREIDRAKKEWALENNKPDSTVPKKADLLPFLKQKQFPGCPAGGDYTIDAVSDQPECSIPGHAIP